jgi:hypothetical protein
MTALPYTPSRSRSYLHMTIDVQCCRTKRAFPGERQPSLALVPEFLHGDISLAYPDQIQMSSPMGDPKLWSPPDFPKRLDVFLDPQTGSPETSHDNALHKHRYHRMGDRAFPFPFPHISNTLLIAIGVGVIDVSQATIDPSQGAFAVANNLRIASLSIAAYDYFLTLPSEVRLYKTTSRRSLGFILFVLIRYSSMIVMVTSNTGFFYHHFSPKTCAHYCYVAPVFKVIQLMVSQAILGIRTYNIAQRNIWIGRIIGSAYFIATAFQWFTALYNRQAEMTNVSTTLSLHSRSVH